MSSAVATTDALPNATQEKQHAQRAPLGKVQINVRRKNEFILKICFNKLTNVFV